MAKPTLGIIGGGQLGSLLSTAANKIGIQTVVLSDDSEAPAKEFSNKFIYGNYNDENIIREFIESVDIITYEFENIPYNILKQISMKKSVLPNAEINKLIQNRFTEKNFLNKINIATTNYELIRILRI